MSSYSGTTSVTGGTLSIGSDAVNGSILGPVTVASGAALTGSGSVGGLTVQGGGRLAPGNVGDIFNGAGIVTINNNLDLGAPSTTLSLSLGGTLNDPTGAVSGTSTVQYGQLIVTSGEVFLGGSLQLAFINGGVYAPQIGDTYYIVENETGFPVSGEFSNGQVFLGQTDFETGVVDLGNGESFAISYTANAMIGGQAGFAPGQGDDVALQLLSVPEPRSASCALTGLSLLLGLQRFRRTREARDS
jgi:fibronectin-binding autotransporter adhesin